MSLADALATARSQLAESKPQEAWRTLSQAFGRPPDGDDSTFVEVLRAASEACRGFGAAPFADQLDACAAAPGDVRRLYDTAYALYEERQFPVASALLYRANQLAPRQPGIVAELASCLEAQLRYGEAALVLDTSGVADHDPMCAYLSGYNNLMAGDIDAARSRLPLLAGSDDKQLVFVRDALVGMLSRAQAVQRAGIALDDRALVAWHAVLNESLLLHLSPHGWPDPMRGRYAYVADSPGQEREGLERAVALLRALDALPPRILAAPDRASRILAAAAARVSGLPWSVWSGEVEPALVVAWSLEGVGDGAFLEAMHAHRPGQVLFAHVSCWTEPFPYAPDLTTMLHQQATNPWTGGALRVDPAGGGLKRAEPDDRDEEVIGAEIAAAELADPSAGPGEDVIAIAVALRGLPALWRPGLFRTEGPRARQRAGGPVPSNRFY